MTDVQPPDPLAPLAAVSAAFGEPVRDAYPLAHLSALLTRAGYTGCDPDALAHLAALGRVPRPGPGGWSADGAAAVLVYLDLCRCWRADSPYHAARMTPFHRERLEAATAGRRVPEVDAHSLLFQVRMLAAQPEPTYRQALAEGLLARLDQLGVDPHA